MGPAVAGNDGKVLLVGRVRLGCSGYRLRRGEVEEERVRDQVMYSSGT